MKPACRQLAPSLSLWAAGCLPERERDAVAGHLAGCAACQARFAELRTLTAALAAEGQSASAAEFAVRGPSPLRAAMPVPRTTPSGFPALASVRWLATGLWPMGGAAATAVLLVWLGSASPFGRLTQRTSTVQSQAGLGHGAAGDHANAVAAAAWMDAPRLPGTFFGLGNFADERARYAMLEQGSGVETAVAFPLDVPAGPMRLNCTSSASGGDLSAALFGPFFKGTHKRSAAFHLNVSK